MYFVVVVQSASWYTCWKRITDLINLRGPSGENGFPENFQGLKGKWELIMLKWNIVCLGQDPLFRYRKTLWNICRDPAIRVRNGEEPWRYCLNPRLGPLQLHQSLWSSGEAQDRGARMAVLGESFLPGSQMAICSWYPLTAEREKTLPCLSL